MHPAERVAGKVIRYVSVVLSVGSGIIFTLVWIKLGKSFWKFPHILVWYMFMFSMGLGVVELVNLAVASEETMCSSDDLLDALQTPKAVCVVLGILFHYFQITLLMW
eukprot:m.190236 g.190236  ORF g.190236 m.190236 type:complete len:107 (+) comp39431_c0_seq2:507-827(+)